MKSRSLLLPFIILLFSSLDLSAQDEKITDNISISGSIDAFLRIPFDSKSRVDAAQAPATSFANSNGFSLGMANIVLSKESGKVGFVADLVFGPRGSDAVFNSAAPSNIINQLYAYWNVNDKLKFTFGNFNTFLGYEVISPASNFNYSTSYMFSYGPFSHSGIKADYAFSDKWSAMIAIMNPTDWTDFNPFGTYTYGAQLGYNGVYLNFLYGDQDGKLDPDLDIGTGATSAGSTFQVDLTAGWDLTETVYFGLNATYNTTAIGELDNGTAIVDATGEDAGFYGAALYFQIAAFANLSVGTRVEYFKEFNNALGVIGLDGNGDGNVLDVTLSGNYKVGSLTIIPELRLDQTSEDTFVEKSNTGMSKSLSSFVLAAVYSF